MVSQENNHDENNKYLKPEDLGPKKGDKLHKTDGRKNEIAIAFANPNDFSKVAYSFFSAADNLAEDSGKVIVNSWIYPIVYMYGHYMELTLKEIIRLGELHKKTNGNPDTSDFKNYTLDGKYTGHKGHNLKFLWKDAKKYMFKMDSEGFNTVKEELSIIENCINELNKLYGGGTNFRYPDELKSDINININTLKETMSKIQSTLGGYILGINNRVFN